MQPVWFNSNYRFITPWGPHKLSFKRRPTIDQAHLPPICCHDELISRLKKTCTDPEPTRSSKYYLPGKLKQKHLTKLILGCTRNYQVKVQLKFEVHEKVGVNNCMAAALMLMCSSSGQKCFDIKRVESLRVGSSEASLERLYTCTMCSCLLVHFPTVFGSLYTAESVTFFSHNKLI
ncbi:hypothetical protein NC653_002646 [Populus alba x Populus x berolinensis]|uniref:Uncharacterized protein n=1 Tax=Populus alba x Populus x berolinensis TaxID=444605 RepID=A0AAD6RP76_9ROSI|nr:hypothetical protein NC653_002646 [Populus alba x Populus x berolinensis]